MKISNLLSQLTGQPNKNQTMDQPYTLDIQKKNESVEHSIQKTGLKVTPKLKKIAQKLQEYNKPITRENLEAINDFMDNTEGSTESKLEAVDYLLAKDLPVTLKNLKDVHAALNKEFDPRVVVKEATKASKSSKISKKALIKLIEKSDIPKELKEQLIKSLNNDQPLKLNLKDLISQLDRFIDKTEGESRSIETLSTEALVAEVIKTLETVAKSLSTSEEFFFNETEDPTLERVSSDKSTSSLEDSSTDDLLQTIEQTFESIEENIEQLMDDVKVENGMMEALSVALDQPTFKVMLTREVTQELANVAMKFHNVKTSIQKDLSKVSYDIEQKEVKVSTHEALQKAVESLDKTILRSEMTLYTDMSLEKKLLNFSSELQEARKHLDNSQLTKAFKIIRKVQNQLSKINFKPTKDKIIGVSLNKGFGYSESLGNKFALDQPIGSPRQMLELFRTMGLNHDFEMAEALLHNESKDTLEKLDLNNMKEVLLQLKEDTNYKITGAENDKIFSNLSGQQLLNTPDEDKSKQNMYFNIPYELNETIKNMHLFVNSRKNNHKMDWENCDLYFVIQLKDYGETGIRISSKNRGLSVVIKNNHHVEKAIQPMLKSLKDSFEETGYTINSIRFTDLSNAKTQEKTNPMISKTVDKTSNKHEHKKEKRFDFKI